MFGKLCFSVIALVIAYIGALAQDNGSNSKKSEPEAISQNQTEKAGVRGAKKNVSEINSDVKKKDSQKEVNRGVRPDHDARAGIATVDRGKVMESAVNPWLIPPKLPFPIRTFREFGSDSNKVVCLNETSAIVWKLCNGKRTTSEIAEEVSRKLKKPVTDELIWLAIDQMKRENLLSNGEAMETSLNGLTRREVVRKVGIASMVALPMVSPIVAPRAIAAQSPCVAPGTCIAMGQDFCAGCIGQSITVVEFFSTDGSCTNPIVAPPSVFNCTGPQIFPLDIRVV